MSDEERAVGSGEDETMLEEEFTVWKKNTPFLYDLVISHSLEWPSLTVQWLPSQPSLNAADAESVHKLVLGTHTADECPNFLMLADVHLPSDPVSALEPNSEDVIPKVEIVQKVHVDGEVNRARCVPQNPSIIAAKTSSSEVYVFNFANQLGNEGEGSCNPDLRLKGHDKEGYGLSWSPFKEGYLLSGSNDCKICLWDISTMPSSKVLDATHIYQEHESLVEDVSWHLKNANLFGSVGDDCRLIIWDLRTNKPQYSGKVHDKEVNYLSFNPFNEWVVATASSDSTVGLFDMRKLSSPLHALSSHTCCVDVTCKIIFSIYREEVFQVEWDPNHETVLASSAGDRRLMVWDLNKVGDEQLEGEAEDGPSELLFSHGGHKAKISDFSWNKNEPWVISSVAEDNALQVWQMAESIYREDYD